MRKLYLFTLSVFTFFSAAGQQKPISGETKLLQKHYRTYEKTLEKERKYGRKFGAVPPNEYNEQDIKNTMDPVTGQTNYSKMFELKKDISAGRYKPRTNLSLLSSTTAAKGFDQQWIERGPYSVGGRTRAIMYDPNDASGRRVFAGAVSGGLWVNEDPSVSTNEWTPINDFWANTSISCITYDPNDPKVFYVGTGEASTGDAIGSGIWKTTDGGTTWTQIFTMTPSYSGTVRNGYFYINDIKVRNNNGVSEVYAGVSGSSVSINFTDGFAGLAQAGLYKSTDGGATFTKNTSFMPMNTTTNVESTTTGYSIQQIEIGADNAVWVSTRSSRYSNIDSGGRIFKSADGETFTQVYKVDVSTAVNANRVNFALSKTDPNKAYGLLQGANSTTEPVRIIKTTDGGATWIATSDTVPLLTLPVDADTGIPANDFTRGQSFYDLVIATDPENDEIVYTGGIDLFKSVNGGLLWTQISKWSNNNNLAALQISLVHADQHAIVFNPKNSRQMLFGNDGGIYFVNDNTSFLDATSTFRSTVPVRNNRYNTTQFYGAVLNPTTTSAAEDMLAGAQDNGTVWLSGAPAANGFYTTYTAQSGDGMYPEYDDNDKYEIASYVYNNHYIVDLTKATPAWKYIISTSANRNNYGHFVNEMALDRVNEHFYSYRSGLSIFRTLNLLTSTSYTNTAVTLAAAQTSEQISKLKVSPFTTTSGTTLFFGTNQGRIFKVTNADKASFVTTSIGTPAVGTISDIAFGATENDIVVTLSNFNVRSIFSTADGGTTWTNKEGNLPDMPVRAVLVNPDDTNEVLVGTEVGVWGTSNFSNANPTWAQYSNGIGNVRVTNFDYRPSTKTVLVSTYGRGAWTSQNSGVVLATGEAKNKHSVLLYPNPTRGETYLRYDSAKYKNVTVTVYDTAGKLVYTKKNVKSDESINTGLPNGNYVLKADSDGQAIFSSFLQIGKPAERD